MWADLDRGVKAFTQESHRLLESHEPVQRDKLETLFLHHGQVVQLANKLIKSSSEHLIKTEHQLEQQSQRMRAQMRDGT